jgi:hypothetical protein
MTRPTTSSIIAALVSTTPSLLFVRALVFSTVRVVPKLVEHRAAPAANAWRDVAFARRRRENESPIGKQTPVAATAMERKRFAFSADIDVDRPPKWSSSDQVMKCRRDDHTFVDKQDKANVSQLSEDFLGGLANPLRAW